MDAMTLFPQKLKDLREECGLNQSQLADRLGVSRGSISFYENGDRVPDIEFLFRVSKFFNLSADWLLGLTEVRTQIPEVKAVCEYTGLSEGAVAKLHSSKSLPPSPNMALLFINEFIDSRDFLSFRNSAWRTVISDVLNLRNDDGISLSALRMLDAGELNEILDRASENNRLKESAIDQCLLDFLNQKREFNNTLEVSSGEFSNLFYNRAKLCLEAAFDRTISHATDAMIEEENHATQE